MSERTDILAERPIPVLALPSSCLLNRARPYHEAISTSAEILVVFVASLPLRDELRKSEGLLGAGTAADTGESTAALMLAGTAGEDGSPFAVVARISADELG